MSSSSRWKRCLTPFFFSDRRVPTVSRLRTYTQPYSQIQTQTQTQTLTGTRTRTRTRTLTLDSSSGTSHHQSIALVELRAALRCSLSHCLLVHSYRQTARLARIDVERNGEEEKKKKKKKKKEETGEVTHARARVGSQRGKYVEALLKQQK